MHGNHKSAKHRSLMEQAEAKQRYPYADGVCDSDNYGESLVMLMVMDLQGSNAEGQGC